MVGGCWWAGLACGWLWLVLLCVVWLASVFAVAALLSVFWFSLSPLACLGVVLSVPCCVLCSCCCCCLSRSGCFSFSFYCWFFSIEFPWSSALLILERHGILARAQNFASSLSRTRHVAKSLRTGAGEGEGSPQRIDSVSLAMR